MKISKKEIIDNKKIHYQINDNGFFIDLGY